MKVIPNWLNLYQEFPEGCGGFNLKNLLWEGYGYFLEKTHYAPINVKLLGEWGGGGRA